MRIPITVFSYVALSLPLLLTGCKSDQRKDPAPATTTNPATTAAEGTNKAGADSAAAAEAEALEHKLAEFAPVTITADVTALPASEQQALTALIEAARLLDPVFERQVYSGNPALSTKLSADDSRLGKARYGYFQLMRGPWDRQDALADFAQAGPRPPGGGYYPDDLTEEAFRAYLDAHPDQREALTSPYTVVRHDGDALVAVPYSEAYAEWSPLQFVDTPGSDETGVGDLLLGYRRRFREEGDTSPALAAGSPGASGRSTQWPHLLPQSHRPRNRPHDRHGRADGDRAGRRAGSGRSQGCPRTSLGSAPSRSSMSARRARSCTGSWPGPRPSRKQDPSRAAPWSMSRAGESRS